MAARYSPELAHLLRVAARAMERDALAAIRVAGFDMVAPRHFTLFRVLDPETFGTGMLAEPLANGHCGLTAGGTFAGPREGDIGDWTGLYVTAEGCPPGAFRISNGNEGISRSGYYGCLPLYYYGNQ